MKARCDRGQCCGQMLERGYLGELVRATLDRSSLSSQAAPAILHCTQKFTIAIIQRKSGRCVYFERDESLADSVAPGRNSQVEC